jgi:hypothetical protein
MRGAGRGHPGVLEEAVRHVERIAIEDADDLALAVQPLVPDARRPGRARLERPGGVRVVQVGLRHLVDDADLRHGRDARDDR